MSEWDDDELRSLRAFFLDEADEHLDAARAELGQLRSRSGEGEMVSALLRTLHTIKGSAGSVELPEVARAAHAFEDRLIALRAAPTTTDGALPALEAALGRARLARRGRARRGAPAPTAAARRRRRSPSRRNARDRRAVERPVPGQEQTVRVEVERIDELMDAASELVFDRTRLPAACRISKRARRMIGDGEILKLAGRAVDDAEGLRRTSATLQEGIRRVRMMSSGPAVRSAWCSRCASWRAKRARRSAVRTAGEETEIDKAVVERVAEPLLHLVRNCRRPRHRVARGAAPALGKPRAGHRSR